MIELSEIVLTELPSVPIGQTELLPNTSGVYAALSSAGTPLYIGSTNNLKRRWCSHDKLSELRANGAATVAFFEFPETGIYGLEVALIGKFAPALNKTKAAINPCCPSCGSRNTYASSKNRSGSQRYRCKNPECKRMFTDNNKQQGRPLEEGRSQPLSNTERKRRWREKQKQAQ